MQIKIAGTNKHPLFRKSHYLHVLANGDFSMEIEVWKDVVGYEGLYQVSDLGRVKRIAGGFGATIGRILKPGDGRGYKRVVLVKNGKRRNFNVHGLVMRAFVGEVPDGMEVNHIDTNRGNNRLTNLEYLTKKQNAEHAVAMGHYKRGENNGNSKLNPEIVLAIRQDYASKMKKRLIAQKYQISEANVYSITSRSTWKHI